jgi:hypothetical protein
MKSLFCILALLVEMTTFSQDTITLMQYNLLMFGNNFSTCNQSNNSYITKTENLKTILNYVKPDILMVNEINQSVIYHNYILTEALNIGGTNSWQRANPPNLSNSEIINQIFYNSDKMNLITHEAIETNVRDIDIFRLKYYPECQPEYVDMNCIVAHLKAGNEDSDELERSNETNILMNFLHNEEASGNYTFSGDFNVYTAAEQAFQNLLFHSDTEIRFYDPIDAVGSWNNNSYYAPVHTQSTHTSGDCFSTGGMDDRFDFILVSDEILNGSQNMKYVPESYHALGQDGNHFNNYLTSNPQNLTVPEDVLNALYNMSDHLPVLAKFAIGENLGVENIKTPEYSVSFQNPVHDQLNLLIKTRNPQEFIIRIINPTGQLLMMNSYQIETSSKSVRIPFTSFPNGIYFIQISPPQFTFSTLKIIKN